MQSFRVGGGWLQSYTGCSGTASLGRGQLSMDVKEELQGAVFLEEGPGRGLGGMVCAVFVEQRGGQCSWCEVSREDIRVVVGKVIAWGSWP